MFTCVVSNLVMSSECLGICYRRKAGMCVYIYIYIYIYVCMYVCVCIYVCMYMTAPAYSVISLFVANA